MKYESENLRIRDEAEDIDPEIDAKMIRIKKKIIQILDEEELTLDMVLSLFATMYVLTAHRVMEMPIEVALEAITGALMMQYAEEEMAKHKGDMQWLN